MGIPITLIGEAVFSRCLSALKSDRLVLSEEYPNTPTKIDVEKSEFIKDIKNVFFF